MWTILTTSLRWPPVAATDPEMGRVGGALPDPGVRPDQEHVERLADRRLLQVSDRHLRDLVEPVLHIGVAATHCRQGQDHHHDASQEHPVEPPVLAFGARSLPATAPPAGGPSRPPYGPSGSGRRRSRGWPAPAGQDRIGGHRPRRWFRPRSDRSSPPEGPRRPVAGACRGPRWRAVGSAGRAVGAPPSTISASHGQTLATGGSQEVALSRPDGSGPDRPGPVSRRRRTRSGRRSRPTRSRRWPRRDRRRGRAPRRDGAHRAVSGSA